MYSQAVMENKEIKPNLKADKDLTALQRRKKTSVAFDFLEQVSVLQAMFREQGSYVIQRMLNRDNVTSYYDIVLKKDEAVKVSVGTLKKEHNDSGYPKNIVMKEGLGADEDARANMALQGEAGIYNVITQGDNYFIREAFGDDDSFSKWAELYKYQVKIVSEAIELSINLLNKGIIDKDRKVYLYNPEAIELQNMHISKENGATLYFFDFEPVHTINWTKGKFSFEDRDAFDTWKNVYTSLVRNFAIKLKGDSEAAEAELMKRAQIILEKYGATGFLEAEKDEDRGSYQPPMLFEMTSDTDKGKSKSSLFEGLTVKESFKPENPVLDKPKVSFGQHNITETQRKKRIAAILDSKIKKYYRVTKEEQDVLIMKEMIRLWLEQENFGGPLFSKMMKYMTKWRDTYREANPDWKSEM